MDGGQLERLVRRIHAGGLQLGFDTAMSIVPATFAVMNRDGVLLPVYIKIPGPLLTGDFAVDDILNLAVPMSPTPDFRGAVITMEWYECEDHGSPERRSTIGALTDGESVMAWTPRHALSTVVLERDPDLGAMCMDKHVLRALRGLVKRVNGAKV